MYGVFVRFYAAVIPYGVLELMKEDLIEMLTSKILGGPTGKAVLELCRIITYQEEQDLSRKFVELKDIRPEEIGIDKYFTLNKSSMMMDLYRKHE